MNRQTATVTQKKSLKYGKPPHLGTPRRKESLSLLISNFCSGYEDRRGGSRRRAWGTVHACTLKLGRFNLCCHLMGITSLECCDSDTLLYNDMLNQFSFQG